MFWIIRKIFKLIIIIGVVVWGSKAYAYECLKTHNFVGSETSIKASFRYNETNLRAGPGVRFCVNRMVTEVKGEAVTIIQIFEGWRLIRYKDDTLWVHGALLSKSS